MQESEIRRRSFRTPRGNFVSPGLRGETLGEPFVVERSQAPPGRERKRHVGVWFIYLKLTNHE